MDLCKAFDSVAHTILLSKLDHFGIRELPYTWFSSYLSNRKQYVSIGGTYSNKQVIRYGGPQGSVLGPLLFLLLFINDFKNCSDVIGEFHLFAILPQIFYLRCKIRIYPARIRP